VDRYRTEDSPRINRNRLNRSGLFLSPLTWMEGLGTSPHRVRLDQPPALESRPTFSSSVIGNGLTRRCVRRRLDSRDFRERTERRDTEAAQF